MHLAALEDHVTVAQQLIREGAKATAVTLAGYTPLHTACYAGRLNMARFLLPNSDINARTKSTGFTPLHLAAQQGHSDIVFLLLEHGADPNAKNCVSSWYPRVLLYKDLDSQGMKSHIGLQVSLIF